MSSINWLFDPSVYRYILDTMVQEHPVLAKLRHATQEVEMAQMQITPEQGQFLQWLVGLMGVQQALEIGCFTGYSALALALALPTTGRLITCDVSERWTSVAKPFWQEAGVAEKIDLRLAPALQTLEALLPEKSNTFDFAFIDANKTDYPTYYELCYQLVRPGGVLVLDNMLWKGRVADSTVTDARTVTLRTLAQTIAQDTRVSACLLPIADGLLLARKL